MELRFSSIFCILLHFHGSNASIYFNAVGDNHVSAQVNCESYGGKLLEYGLLFIKTLEFCNYTSLYTWTGLPFYSWLTSDGCRYGFANKQTPIEEIQEDKQVAVCADFCSSDNYTHFGLTTAECFCYDQETFNSLGHSDICATLPCSVNVYDTCGISPDAVGYQKVWAPGIFDCCARAVIPPNSGHQLKGFCLIDLPYICKVGDSNDIKCSFSDLTATTQQTEKETMSTTVLTSPTDQTTTDRVTAKQTETETMSTTVLTSPVDQTTTEKVITSVLTVWSTDSADSTSAFIKDSSTTVEDTYITTVTTTNIVTSTAETRNVISLSTYTTRNSDTALSETSPPIINTSDRRDELTSSDSKFTTEILTSGYSTSSVTQKSSSQKTNTVAETTTSSMSAQNIATGTYIYRSSTSAINDTTSGFQNTIAPDTFTSVGSTQQVAIEPDKTQIQEIIIGVTAAVCVLLFMVMILIVIIKACKQKVREENRNKRKRLVIKPEQQPVGNSMTKSTQLFRNMYSFPYGVNPFTRRLRFNDNEEFVHKPYGYNGYIKRV